MQRCSCRLPPGAGRRFPAWPSGSHAPAPAFPRNGRSREPSARSLTPRRNGPRTSRARRSHQSLPACATCRRGARTDAQLVALGPQDGEPDSPSCLNCFSQVTKRPRIVDRASVLAGHAEPAVLDLVVSGRSRGLHRASGRLESTHESGPPRWPDQCVWKASNDRSFPRSSEAARESSKPPPWLRQGKIIQRVRARTASSSIASLVARQSTRHGHGAIARRLPAAGLRSSPRSHELRGAKCSCRSCQEGRPAAQCEPDW